MNEENNYSEYFTSGSKIFIFALKKWKFLLGVLVVSAAMAVVFSGPKFISPEFESKAVVYPANLGEYSDETRIEQMQQYLESNLLRDIVIQKFNLYDEYDIDSNLNSSRNAVYEEYSNHIYFDETRFESISITVRSKDPVKAKEIADEIISQLDRIIRETERVKYHEHVVINKKLMDQKRIQVDSLQNMITELSTKYGILDYLVQTEMVTEGYLEFLLKGKKGEEYDEVKELYENLKKYGRHYHNLNVQLNEINLEFLQRLNNYEHSLKDYNKRLTHTYVLVNPEVTDKKVFPVRWLIVLSASLSATFFAFMLFVILGSRKDL